MTIRARLATTLAAAALALTGVGLIGSATHGSATAVSGSVAAAGPDNPITTGWPGGARDRKPFDPAS